LAVTEFKAEEGEYEAPARATTRKTKKRTIEENIRDRGTTDRGREKRKPKVLGDHFWTTRSTPDKLEARAEGAGYDAAVGNEG